MEVKLNEWTDGCSALSSITLAWAGLGLTGLGAGAQAAEFSGWGASRCPTFTGCSLEGGGVLLLLPLLPLPPPICSNLAASAAIFPGGFLAPGEVCPPNSGLSCIFFTQTEDKGRSTPHSAHCRTLIPLFILSELSSSAFRPLCPFATARLRNIPTKYQPLRVILQNSRLRFYDIRPSHPVAVPRP
jgi:hypothetical protein